jgi:hypothetical protein
VKVSTLKSRTHRIWIEVPGDDGHPPEKIWVDYRPGELTLAVTEKIRHAMETGFESDVIFVVLSSVLAAWDLQVDVLDEFGMPTGEVRQLGNTEEDIKSVPLSFLGEVLAAIEAGARPNPQRDVTSDAGSPQVEQSVTSQTGTSSFAPQTD